MSTTNPTPTTTTALATEYVRESYRLEDEAISVAAFIAWAAEGGDIVAADEAFEALTSASSTVRAERECPCCLDEGTVRRPSGRMVTCPECDGSADALIPVVQDVADQAALARTIAALEAAWPVESERTPLVVESIAHLRGMATAASQEAA